jgi:hypothetical protein
VQPLQVPRQGVLPKQGSGARSGGSIAATSADKPRMLAVPRPSSRQSPEPSPAAAAPAMSAEAAAPQSTAAAGAPGRWSAAVGHPPAAAAVQPEPAAAAASAPSPPQWPGLPVASGSAELPRAMQGEQAAYSIGLPASCFCILKCCLLQSGPCI